MSVTTARGLARASWLPRQQRYASASTSSRASQPPSSPPHARKSSKPPAAAPPPIIRPYKPAAPKSARKTNNSQPDTLQSIWRRSWLPLSGAALVAGFLGFYIVGTAAASLKGQCSCGSSPASCHQEKHQDGDATPTGRPPALTGDNAEQFDHSLDFPEWWMGITKLRRRLAEHATGHVLELAVGTGRNLEYYNWDGLDESGTDTQTKTDTKTTNRAITSFTGLDISVDMLDVARKRLTRTVPPLHHAEPVVKKATMADHTGGQLAFLNHRLRLVHSDAHRALPPVAAPSQATPPPAAKSNSKSKSKTTPPAPSPPTHYDTIIQTFGLCSVSDPVAVLCNLASAIKPHTGRILLLEHGMGWSGLINGLLDKYAPQHFAKYGCWWNRDIEALVEEAVRRTPGLEVVRLTRPNVLQMGTLVWIELRVREGKDKDE
ncbi:hypothetical protein E4U55_001171 [Claviceps digitariae]|nr:hypothetical protein E4U55_001171 [Claviceps digitariae]